MKKKEKVSINLLWFAIPVALLWFLGAPAWLLWIISLPLIMFGIIFAWFGLLFFSMLFVIVVTYARRKIVTINDVPYRRRKGSFALDRIDSPEQLTIDELLKMMRTKPKKVE